MKKILHLKLAIMFFIKSYNQKGQIIDQKKDEYIVKFGAFELPFNASNLTLTNPPKPKKRTKTAKSDCSNIIRSLL